MKQFQVLTEIKNTSSSNTKLEILRTNDTPTLRKLLNYTYDPYKNYYVKKLDLPTTFNTISVDVSEELFQLLDILSKRQATPTQARAFIKNLLAKTTEEDAKWICKVISKDLKIGISESTINKAFPNLIPEFKVSLALPMTEPKSGDTRWDSVVYGQWIQEEKIDALRCIAICDGEKVTFRSREGNEFESLEFLAKEVMALMPGASFVLDGEISASVYNENCKVAKKNYEAGTNWRFAQADSMVTSKKQRFPLDEMKKHLVYVVWDIIPLDYFVSKGKNGTCKTLKHRKTELAGMFERAAELIKNIKLIDNRLIESREDAISYHREIVANGGEGTMLKNIEVPYEFKRTANILKLKDFYPADLRIIGAIEGEVGSQYEGSLGALILSDDGVIRSECGSGIDADLRLEMWFRHMRGELVGGIVEVIYQEVTADNSLRSPVFVRERPDKKVTSMN